jgi:hypothetical protein
VIGRLQRSSGDGSILIVVNGPVAAVSEIYPEAGTSSFAGTVNDMLFNGGKNDLVLYEIVGGPYPELAPITIRRGRATAPLGCHAGIGLGCSLMRSLGDFCDCGGAH